MKYLTKIKKPFGLLKPEVQAALKAHGGPYEHYGVLGWKWIIGPSFLNSQAYRVAPEPVPPPDQIDWTRLPIEFKWAARDKSGQARVFSQRPKKYNDYWSAVGGHVFNITNLSPYTRGTADWKDSLLERPQ